MQLWDATFNHQGKGICLKAGLWYLTVLHGKTLNSSCSVFSEGTDFSVLWVLIVHKLLFFQWSKKFP